jgi:hypothetical protein
VKSRPCSCHAIVSPVKAEMQPTSAIPCGRAESLACSCQSGWQRHMHGPKPCSSLCLGQWRAHPRWERAAWENAQRAWEKKVGGPIRVDPRTRDETALSPGGHRLTWRACPKSQKWTGLAQSRYAASRFVLPLNCCMHDINRG